MPAVQHQGRRPAANELLFRAVNEQIIRVTHGLHAQLGLLDLVCECSDPDCTGTISVTAEEFAEVVRRGQYLVLPGHEHPRRPRLV